MSDLYAQPHDVSDVQFAFPAALGELLPPLSVIPPDYPHRVDWLRFQNKLFCGSLPDGCEVEPADGIDPIKAGRHIMTIQRSYEPKHEHKEAAVAWLASRWFVRISHPDNSYNCPSSSQLD